MSIKENSSSFYEYYPKLFHSYFPDVEEEVVNLLSKAGFHFYQSVMQLDAIIDNQENYRIFNVLDLQEYSIKILATIYGNESDFWSLWKIRKNEFRDAILLEKNLWNNFSVENYKEVADKKSAFGKVAIDCLYTLSKSKDEKKYHILLESHKYFSIAFQLYDDVVDFEDDFNKKQFNKSVYQLSQIIDFSKYNNDPIILNKLLYIEEVGIDILNKSIAYLEKAKEIAYELCENSLWIETIDNLKFYIIEYRNITYSYIKTVQERVKIKKISAQKVFLNFENIDNLNIFKGLSFIKLDYLQNYVDLTHIMYLGGIDGFENDTDIHSSDTFQRALLNDCLLDISEKFNLDTKYFFQKEKNYFIERQNNDDIGGWSYFPTVQEIAADIDDLGQIMQYFIRTNNVELIKEHCLKAIEIAINERTQTNGGIETWIIPQKNLTEKQKKQELFNSTKWGKGPDVEVVANFIYALNLLDSEKYRSTIENSIRYILSEQKEQGYWESRWYYSKFYGTFVCLRILSQFPTQYGKTKEKVKEFLLNSQNEDGSFDVEQYKNLSTSFAIFCINLLDFPELGEMKKKAQDYLIKNQLEDGSWTAENFIKPKAHEPYKSKTLTTAYVLKALL